MLQLGTLYIHVHVHVCSSVCSLCMPHYCVQEHMANMFYVSISIHM